MTRGTGARGRFTDTPSGTRVMTLSIRARAAGLALAVGASSLIAHGAAFAAEPSRYIVLDQFGYLPDAEKVAVVRDPMQGYDAAASFSPGATLEVRDAATDALVFSGAPTIWNGGAVQEQSGDRGWWFDFSELTTPGSYTVVDPASGERTGAFDIRDDVYRSVLRDAARMFYYNRANLPKRAPYAESPWVDGPSYTRAGQDRAARSISDPDNAALEKNLSGGWFDAGDPNKYVTFAEYPVHDLLTSFEESPDAWRGLELGIPESGDAVPDILDEVRWELAWVMRMMNADGSTHIKVGDRAGTYARSPPSVNVNPRYYGPVCTSSTLAAAGMLAHAARVYEGQPGQQAFAQRARRHAERAFRWAEPKVYAGRLDTDCDDLAIRAGDADVKVYRQYESAVTAAVYLRELTGDARYSKAIDAWVGKTRPLSVYPTLDGEEGWTDGSLTIADSLLRYLWTAPPGDATAARIKASLGSLSEGGSENYGWSERDLYRAEQWIYSWGFGSNFAHSGWAMLHFVLADVGVRLDSGADVRRRGVEALHYFHGVNPFGLVQLSAMEGRGAERSVRQLSHFWFVDGSPWDDAETSAYGPAPGFLVTGANRRYGLEEFGGSPALQPPFGQPLQKSYLDSNDERGPDGELAALYQVSEPAIYQATYVRLLARLVR